VWERECGLCLRSLLVFTRVLVLYNCGCLQRAWKLGRCCHSCDSQARASGGDSLEKKEYSAESGTELKIHDRKELGGVHADGSISRT